MPHDANLKYQILKIQDTIDELKDLDEFFLLYYDSLQDLYSRYMGEHGIHLNLRRIHLLVDSHETFNQKLLKDLESNLKKLKELAVQIEAQGRNKV